MGEQERETNGCLILPIFGLWFLEPTVRATVQGKTGSPGFLYGGGGGGGACVPWHVPCKGKTPALLFPQSKTRRTNGVWSINTALLLILNWHHAVHSRMPFPTWRLAG